jgi:putative membrane protein
MTTDWLLASGHHLMFVLLIACLAGEASLLRQQPSAKILQGLGRLDLFYGLSALAIFVIGGLRVGNFGAKPWAFYSGNPVFWLKLGLFVLIGLISIIPTLRYMRWKKDLAGSGKLPSEADWASTRKLAVAQLHLIALMVIAATAMARGIGY